MSHTEAPPTAPAGLRLRDPAAARAWTRGALDLEPRLAAFGGQYLRDPAHQLACASVRRQLGLQADAIGTLKMALAAGHAEPRTDPWQGRFAEELRLLVAEGGEGDGAARGVCRFTTRKPHLDGRLDDDCWGEATAMPLTKWVGDRKNGEPAHATQAKFLYDDRYLYVAVNCTHPTAAPTPRATSRGYDADLSGRDRVEILLDLDRDGGSYYRLRVDAGGRVADDCTGDATWNPRWFVAGDSTATGWTAELAIPLGELTGSLARDAVWSLNVVRVVPGVGVGSWSPVPDCVPDPARMGQLRFVGKPDPNAPKAAPALLPVAAAKP